MRSKELRRAFWVVVMAALGLVAAAASTANAQWLENGAAIAVNKKVEVGKHTSDFTLDIPSKGLLVLCQNVEGNDVLLIAGSLTVANGILLYRECEVLANEIKQVNCKVDHITVDFRALLIVHNNRTYVLFEPLVAGGSLASILYLGELCALPEHNLLTGTVVAECLKVSNLEEVDCLTSEITHGLREALNAANLFPADGLRYGAGGAAANVLGVGTARLESGNTWTGHV